jgi:hypothetical protein
MSTMSTMPIVRALLLLMHTALLCLCLAMLCLMSVRNFCQGRRTLLQQQQAAQC